MIVAPTRQMNKENKINNYEAIYTYHFTTVFDSNVSMRYKKKRGIEKRKLCLTQEKKYKK
jgi:hypothetical protein